MEAPLPELPNTLEDEQPRVKAPLDAAPEISAGPAAPTAGAGAAGPEIAGAAPSTPVAAAREPAVEASHREKAKLRATPSSAARAMQRSSAVGSVSPLAYVLLSGACLAMAAGALGTPGLVTRVMFRKPAADPLDAQHSLLMQLNGGALLVASAVAGALAAAAAGGWGGMAADSSDLLRLGLAGQGAAGLAIFLSCSHLIQPYMWPAELATDGAALVLPVLDLMDRGLDVGSLPARLRSARSVAPGSLLGGCHALLGMAFPLLGGALALMPRFTLFHFHGYSYGASTFLLARLAGAADLTLVPLAQLVLKGAAQRGALTSPAARLLNLGMLLGGLVHGAMLAPLLAKGPTGWLLPVALSTWLFATLVSAAGLAASVRLPMAHGAAPVEPTTAESKQD